MGTFQNILWQCVKNMNRGPHFAGSSVQRAFEYSILLLDKKVWSDSYAQNREIERDFSYLNPRTPAETSDASTTEADITQRYEEREKRFFTNLFKLLEAGGFRHITHSDMQHARFNTFDDHRFKVNYNWLDSEMVKRNCMGVPDVKSTLQPEYGVLRNGAVMFVRGSGKISTTGHFWSQKMRAFGKRTASSMYWWFLQFFPSLAEAMDPHVMGWEKAYMESLKNTKNIMLGGSESRLMDTSSQLLGDRSFRHLVGEVKLEDETFNDIVIVFRRKRPRQAVDVHSLWRTGGGIFNPFNVVIRRYKDVPKSDIKLLLPEKTVIHSPANFLSFTSSSCVLLYMLCTALSSVASVGVVSMSFGQFCVASAAAGYAYRILHKLKTTSERHTQIMDSLRDRNLASTGEATLLDLYKESQEQTLKIALMVHYVLHKGTRFHHGGYWDCCHKWTMEDLMRALDKEFGHVSQLCDEPLLSKVIKLGEANKLWKTNPNKETGALGLEALDNSSMETEGKEVTRVYTE